jgi:hypothetical protein
VNKPNKKIWDIHVDDWTAGVNLELSTAERFGFLDDSVSKT